MKRIIIIGAGASGLFCAIKCKELMNNVDVIVLEANKQPLKKLLATGNGRCNLSNKSLSFDQYNGEVTKPIQEIISQFDDQKEFLEEGLLTKWMGNLLYPASEQAKSVAEVLLDRAHHLGIAILTEQTVISLKENNQGYKIICEQASYDAYFVILAMGSQAGLLSTENDRQKIIGNLLPMVPFRPSLTQMYTSPVLKSLKGVRVKAIVKLMDQDALLSCEKGELLFTDYGVSGICVMQLSRFYEPGCHLEIDMMPSLEEEELEAILKKSPLTRPLMGLVNTKIEQYLFKNKEPVRMLKNLKLSITGLRDYKTSQVMQGGVVVRALDDNLESKRHPGLFVIGELLNVTGNCGGYNLHFAFASAKHVANAIEGIINA